MGITGLINDKQLSPNNAKPNTNWKLWYLLISQFSQHTIPDLSAPLALQTPISNQIAALLQLCTVRYLREE